MEFPFPPWMGVYAIKDHFAFAAGIAPESLYPMLSNGQLPPLPEPIDRHKRYGGKFAYVLESVDVWKQQVDQWRADAPARAARKKAARDEALAWRQRQEMEEIRRNQAVIQSGNAIGAAVAEQKTGTAEEQIAKRLAARSESAVRDWEGFK